VTVTAPSVAELRRIDLFDDLDDAELRRWADAAEVLELAPGDLLAEQGRPASAFHLLLEGSVRAIRVVDGTFEPVGTHVAPTWMGAIAVLSESAFGVRMECETRCRVAEVAAERFHDLVLSQRPVHRRILRQFGPVHARITAVDQSRERLASLGTMAAGLAHELNNPAAAARRAAADMAEALDVLGSTLARFVESGVERTGAEQLVALQRAVLERAAGRGALDALDAADAEDALLDALEDAGVRDAWRIAEPLAAAGVDDAWVAEVHRLAGAATSAAVEWVAASLTARALAEELRESADRMSRLVGAVKSYAYMDRGDVVEADVHEGLETTLVVLGHKLKHTQIRLVREYDRSLPRLTLHGGELNQVWTNLLDNAIDALGDQGTITLRTRRDGSCALVEIADDGPGIPPEVQPRIFDPFFTTKAVGKGTGLGLDTARRIVVERHRGSLTVDSEPGRTTFHVWLPLS
jgi:signal transduction histidine kinase